MRQNVRRQLRVLRAYAVVNSLVLIVLATGAFRQATQKFDEITIQRMNVVDADGTLRMVSACRRASRRAAAGFSGRIPRLKGLSLREILFSAFDPRGAPRHLAVTIREPSSAT
jgi:hypothetical protein